MLDYVTDLKYKKTEKVRVEFGGKADEVLSLMRYMIRHQSENVSGEQRWGRICRMFMLVSAFPDESGPPHPSDYLQEAFYRCLHSEVGLPWSNRVFSSQGRNHLVLDEESGDILFVLPRVSIGGQPMDADAIDCPSYAYAEEVLHAAKRVKMSASYIRRFVKHLKHSKGVLLRRFVV